MPLPSRHEAREHARQRLRGCTNTILASYTRDLSGLDEAGIRHDVRRDIELGFAGALLVGETALTFDEYQHFVRVAVDEADGALHVVHHACRNTLEENIAAANAAAAGGAEFALLTYPSSFWPTAVEEIYQYTRAFCDGVELGVIVFPVPLWGFERLHPASLGPDILERLVDDCPNVVAIKAEGGYPSLGGFVDSYLRFAHRVVISMPMEDQALPLKQLVDLPWIGTSYMEYFADRVPRIFGLLEDGRREDAVELFWAIHPARRAGHQLMAGAAGSNFAHRMVWKYMGWLNGMNGGPLRAPTMRMSSGQMAVARDGLLKSGIEPTSDPDELFFVGRCASRAGVR